MGFWNDLDRSALREAVAQFVMGPPGVLAVIGRDADARHYAADVVVRFAETRAAGVARVRATVDRPRSVRDLLFIAWAEVTPKESMTGVPPAVGTQVFATEAEAIAGVGECLRHRGGGSTVVVFDTIDELGPIPRAPLASLCRLADQAGVHVVVFLRAESNSDLPTEFRQLLLGGMPWPELYNGALLSTLVPDELRSEAVGVVAEIQPLVDSDNTIEAQFVYEFFDARFGKGT